MLQLNRDPIGADDILRARDRIAPFVNLTPLHYAERISTELKQNIYLKLENLQRTGSFKPRGSLNKLLSLSGDQRKRGVIASTAGNHGIGLAYAAKSLGSQAEIYIPRWIDASKRALLESYDPRIVEFDSVELAREAAKTKAREQDLVFVSAYNDREMMAGGGTIGLEIFDQLKDRMTSLTVIVPLGGGGLISGVAIALKSRDPSVRIIGVQSENSPLMEKWKSAGQPVAYPLKPSAAEGLAVNMELDTITFGPIVKYVDEILLVSEREILNSVQYGLDEGLYMEPSGAASLAAIRKLVGRDLSPNKMNANTYVGIATGRNMSKEKWQELQATNGL